MKSLDKNYMPTFRGYELDKSKVRFGQTNLLKGVYKIKLTNKKVFIKIGPNFKKLKAEFDTQKIFYLASKKSALVDLVVPKPIKIIKNDQYFGLVTELLPIKNIIALNTTKKVTLYLKVLTFLSNMNQKNPGSYHTHIKTYSALRIFSVLPFFIIKDVFMVDDRYTILKGFIFVVKHLQQWFTLEYNYLCHGDVNTTNIALLNKSSVLLDYGSVLVSHKYYDASIAVNSSWHSVNFGEFLHKDLIKNGLVNKKDRNLFNSFVVYNLLIRLSGKVTQMHQKVYIDRLKKIIQNGNI